MIIAKTRIEPTTATGITHAGNSALRLAVKPGFT